MSKINMYVGSYTNELEQEGIFQIEFDVKSSELTILSTNDESENPSYLICDNEIIYAGNEVNGNGHLSSFRKNKDGKLKLHDAVRAHGDGVCHLYKNFDVIYASNYGSGNIFAVTVTEDGYFNRVISEHDHLKESSRAHCSISFKDERYLYVADLGDDCIYNYQLNNNGSLTVHPTQPYISVGKGSGPRHLAMHPQGNFLYVFSEFSNNIKVLDINADGTLTLNTKIPLPLVYQEAYAADIKFDSKGKYLYISYRGANTIVVYQLLSNNDLEYVGMYDCGGSWPRHFSITDNDEYLVVANQKSDNVCVFEIAEDGSLSKPIAEIAVNRPTCILID